MTHREYRAVPLPALKTRRSRDPAVQVAEIVQETINQMAQQGWTYLRAETVRAMESQGLLRGREEVAYTVLVFDRPASAPPEAIEPFHDDAEPAPRSRERRARPSRPTPVEPDAFDAPDFDTPGFDTPRRPLERAAEREVDRREDRVEPLRRSAAREAAFDDGRRLAAARASRRSEPAADESPLRRRMRPMTDEAAPVDDRIDVGRETPRRSESGFIARAPRPDRQRR